jgi:hypothetical protein
VSFLLDTNVISEWVKPRPDADLAAWLSRADEDRLFISVVTLAELRHGVGRMASGRRRRQLDEWLRGDLPMRFDGRILPIDIAVADAWGRVVARHESSGRPIHAVDAFLAATALANSLAMVTRNASDFAVSGVPVVNPWMGA